MLEASPHYLPHGHFPGSLCRFRGGGDEHHGGAGDGRHQAQGKKGIADHRSDGCQQEDRERRLIDVAPGQVVGTGEVVELVAEDLIAAPKVDGQVERQLESDEGKNYG